MNGIEQLLNGDLAPLRQLCPADMAFIEFVPDKPAAAVRAADQPRPTPGVEYREFNYTDSASAFTHRPVSKLIG